MLSIACHPDALLLREGSPAMLEPEIRLGGSCQEDCFMAEEPGRRISVLCIPGDPSRKRGASG